MFFLRKAFQRNAGGASAQINISAPLSGQFVPQEGIPDSVFSLGILGPGCGIKPVEQVLCAPFDGVIGAAAATRHCLNLISREGVELLLHVGIDTAGMLGRGFTLLTGVGEAIQRGDPLLKFDLQLMQEKRYPAIVCVILENPEEFIIIDTHKTGPVQKGETIFSLSRVCDVAGAGS